MNKKKFIFLGLLSGVIVVILVDGIRSKSIDKKKSVTIYEKKNLILNKKESKEILNFKKKYLEKEFIEFKESELESLQNLLFLTKKVGINPSIKLLVDALQSLSLRPVVMRDQNAYTGNLFIIRTENALEGTRYIHAQYFDDVNKKSILQHFSFEFRPGVHSFELVKKMLQEEIGANTAPVEESASFVSWNIGNRHIWIKQLRLEDMNIKSPFNSYDKQNDLGTIRITNEIEIH